MASKADQIRALRERQYADVQRQTLAPVNKQNQVNKPQPNLLTANRTEYMRRAQTKWRAANPELNRQRAREGMRKRRASAKETA
jgi:hypothetical protein